MALRLWDKPKSMRQVWCSWQATMLSSTEGPHRLAHVEVYLRVGKSQDLNTVQLCVLPGSSIEAAWRRGQLIAYVTVVEQQYG